MELHANQLSPTLNGFAPTIALYEVLLVSRQVVAGLALIASLPGPGREFVDQEVASCYELVGSNARFGGVDMGRGP